MRPVKEIRSSAPDFEQAFVAFYDETKAEVYGFLLARCADTGLAEDLMADTYLAALDAMRRSDQRLTVGWLITVARRRLIDHWRRRTSHRSKLQRLASNRRTSRTTELDEHDTTVLDALGSLPTRQRAAVTLRYVDELSVSEIADALGVEYKAAESLLSRGRASLRRAYQELTREH